MKKIMDLFKLWWSNKWIKNFLIFLMVFTPIVFIDQLTKGLVFNGDKSGIPSNSVADWKFIAFRSQFHTSTTFLDFIGRSMPYWASLLIDYVLIILFSTMLSLCRNKFSAIAVSIALSGIIGNTLDASILKGVRNVFFIPWRDNGTFNFADITIIVGSVLSGISFIYDAFIKDWWNKRSER